MPVPFLPTTKEEMKALGWDRADVVFVTGDAYVDHPSFAMAILGRVLEAQGYGEYCHPPHINRRGHGLGFGSGLPGDVAPDNDIVLEEDMLFVIHPNQYLPETGYMMCGEPTLITKNGAEVLTRSMARMYEVPV